MLLRLETAALPHVEQVGVPCMMTSAAPASSLDGIPHIQDVKRYAIYCKESDPRMKVRRWDSERDTTVILMALSVTFQEKE